MSNMLLTPAAKKYRNIIGVTQVAGNNIKNESKEYLDSNTYISKRNTKSIIYQNIKHKYSSRTIKLISRLAENNNNIEAIVYKTNIKKEKNENIYDNNKSKYSSRTIKIMTKIYDNDNNKTKTK